MIFVVVVTGKISKPTPIRYMTSKFQLLKNQGKI